MIEYIGLHNIGYEWDGTEPLYPVLLLVQTPGTFFGLCPYPNCCAKGLAFNLSSSFKGIDIEYLFAKS